MSTLVLTDRARTELADGAARGVRAVTLTRLATGSGVTPAGTDDTARAALRAQQDAVAAGGDTTVAGRIAFRGDVDPSTSYAVTELGLFARTGAAGAEWLFAYWAGASASDAIARTHPGTTLVVAGIVEIAASAAEITVNPSLTVQVGDPGAATTSRAGVAELATQDEARAGTDATRALTPAGLAAVIPPGTLIDFAGAAVPAGWLACGGQAVSRVAYARLFAALGTTWGAGDGAATFRLPDFRRRVAVGAGGVATTALGNRVGATGGAETVTLTEAQIPAHDHAAGTLETNEAGAHRHRLPDPRTGSPGDPRSALVDREGPYGAYRQTDEAGAHTHSIMGSTAEAGGGTAHPNLPPSAVVWKLIKT